MDIEEFVFRLCVFAIVVTMLVTLAYGTLELIFWR
jgi:hypothetical protein